MFRLLINYGKKMIVYFFSDDELLKHRFQYELTFRAVPSKPGIFGAKLRQYWTLVDTACLATDNRSAVDITNRKVHERIQFCATVEGSSEKKN